MARKTKQEAQETRQHILDVALRLFSQQGVSSTSLGEIAKAAGVTRGAIYWHFKDKSDLFSEIWELSESNIGELELEYQAKFPGDPLSVLTVFCKNGDITNPELSGGKMPDAGRNMTWDLRAPAPTPSHLRATVAIKGSFRGAEF